MFGYILKQIKRAFVSNILFCLLIALTGTLLCIGAGLLFSALQSIRNVDESFTTIALPDTEAIRRYATNRVEQGDIDEYEIDHELYSSDDPLDELFNNHYIIGVISDEIIGTIEEDVYYTDAVEMDTRRFFGAYSQDIIPVLDFGSGLWSSPSHNVAAFVATCTNMTYDYMQDLRREEDGSISGFITRSVSYNFDIDQIVVLHPDYVQPRQFHTTIHYGPDTGLDTYFEVDKQYFISYGSYYANSLDAQGNDMPYLGIGHYGEVIETAVIGRVESLEEFESLPGVENYLYFSQVVLTEDDFPIDIVENYIEEPDFRDVFAIDTSFEQLRSSIDGRDVEFAIEVSRRGAQQLNILTTENIDSLFRFNQKRANITQGRNFTDEEITNGERVCIVPTGLAGKNELNIGDTISLQLYNNTFHASNTFTVSMYDSSMNRADMSWNYNQYDYTMELSEPIEFTIIGTYTDGSYSNDYYQPHRIPDNTIIIPDKSIPVLDDNAEEEWWYFNARTENPLMNTVIVPNGQTEEFRDVINSLIPGYGNFFMYYDQGYSHIMSALEGVRSNAMLIVIVCAVGFVVSVAVFLLFYVMRKRRDVVLLYALGISRKHRFRWVYVQCSIVVIVAMIIALVASIALYNTALEYVYDMSEQQSIEGGDNIFSNTAGIAEDGVVQEFSMQSSFIVLPVTVLIETALLLLAAFYVTSLSIKRTTRQRVEDG